MTELKKVVVLINRNAKMSPGKMASQAVHAALEAYGINHGSVVVLTASKARVEQEPAVIYDEGLTEVSPSTLTAGAHLVDDDWEARRERHPDKF